MCPKPCPSVYYGANPIETFDSQINVTIPCKVKVQPVESQKILEVESNKLKMPGIDPFEDDYSLETLIWQSVSRELSCNERRQCSD